MPPLPLLLVLFVAAFWVWFLFIKKKETNTPVMRRVYGYSDGETLAHMWPNGCFWLREVGPAETAVKVVGSVVGAALGFYVVSRHESFVLSETDGGVFVLNDAREAGGVGVLRFRRDDVERVLRLQKEESYAAVGVGRMERTYDVEVHLRDGRLLWVQIPRSAYEALTGA